MIHRVAMVLCSPFPAPRGTQGYVADLAAALMAEGHRVELWCHPGRLAPERPGGPRLHRAPSLPGVDPAPDSRPSLARPLNDLGVLWRLSRELRRFDPTVVHGHNHEGGAVGTLAGRLLGVPTVHQVHGDLAEELSAWGADPLDPARWARAAAPLAARIDRWLPCRADATVVLDAAAAARHPEARARILPPGVRRVEVHAAKPPSGTVLAYAGNLDPYQDLPRLLEAMARLRRSRPQARLLAVTHDAPARLRAMVARTPGLPEEAVAVRTVRGLEETMSEVKGVGLLAIPRAGGGGYPVKLLNALGAGVPVVTTRAAAKGLGEESGVVAVRPDAAALADAVDALVDDRARRTALEAAAVRFAEAHPFSAVARELAGVYDAIAPLRPRNPRRGRWV